MRTPLVAGNWKMHGSRDSIYALMGALNDGLDSSSVAEVAVFPPFVYLPLVAKLAGGYVGYGAQALCEFEQGAYTGEVSGDMLADFGCRYGLVGHSERRAQFGETDERVAAKFQAAQTHGLMPVLCLGETLEQREAGQTEAVVARQLAGVLDRVGAAAFMQAVVAYEPVWAIGTGKTASPEQAQAVHAHIRDKLAAVDDTMGGQVRILYGGSVKASNARDLFAMADIDGALVGGASLDAGDFLEIVAAAG